MFAHRAQPRILKRVAYGIRHCIEPPFLLRLVRVVEIERVQKFVESMPE